MDKDKLLNNSESFCMAPWMSIHTWPNGNVYPCCLWDSSAPIGNLNTDSIEKIWNSDKLKDTRLKMLNNQRVKECKRCYQLSENSYKDRINDIHGHTFDTVLSTKEDGSVGEIKFTLWDIRISNFCNFKCRSCGPTLSSSWHNDTQILYPGYDVKKPIITIDDKDNFMNTLEPHFKYVDEIYFAGGEPLIMPEHYEILDKLIEKNQLTTNIRYSTNFSMLTYKGKHIFDYWKMFPNLDLFVSVDGVGKIGEYVRKGFKTDLFTQNVKDFFESNIPHKSFGYIVTYGSLNYLHLFDLIVYFINNGLLNKNQNEKFFKQIEFTPITDPSHYDCSFLPNEYKMEFNEKLQSFPKILNDLGLDTHNINYIMKKLTSVKNFSDKNKYNKNKIDELLRITNSLDNIRNENFLDTFTYFKDLGKEKNNGGDILI